jgi:hypothetical protein
MFLDIVSFSNIGTEMLRNCWLYSEVLEYPVVGSEEQVTKKIKVEKSKRVRKITV